MVETMERHEGGCLCGAVRYTVAGAPLLSAVCHCRHCQRQGGGPFSVVCAFESSRFDQHGATRVFDDVGESGLAVDRHFCGECGSPIVSVAHAMPGLTIVKAGTFDDPSFVAPTQEAYCRHAWTILPRLEGAETFLGSNVGADR